MHTSYIICIWGKSLKLTEEVSINQLIYNNHLVNLGCHVKAQILAQGWHRVWENRWTAPGKQGDKDDNGYILIGC